MKNFTKVFILNSALVSSSIICQLMATTQLSTISILQSYTVSSEAATKIGQLKLGKVVGAAELVKLTSGTLKEGQDPLKSSKKLMHDLEKDLTTIKEDRTDLNSITEENIEDLGKASEESSK